ncbi:hypothetical protein DL89DRAFT_267595 [Linderina pennispora]|uniref:F-box domain-containing protein n=1 Tax=Linderina pennispora TaxID=61395 RepID=A0A1Y1W806_9FUNG|nr:uncharacterized protein DL89DRAFT_267595 [Linderina pennispora]ORX69366.1 hypothetical protein DL89DRAFT_267595 [Linderina pennispora]
MEPTVQHLPIPVLERVIYYLTPEKSINVGQHYQNSVYEAIMPVSHVCQSWRQVSLCHAFRYVHVGTHTKPTLKLAQTLKVCDLIKGVTIKLQTNSIFHTPSAALLRRHIASDLSFPSIKSLTFIFAGNIYWAKGALAKLRSRQFSNELLRIFPSITHIGVEHNWDLLSDNLPSHIVNLLKRLLAGRTAITTDGYCLADALPFPPTPVPLQSLATSGCGKMTNVFTLIRKNSQSLQRLHLDLSASVLIRRVVTNSDGSAVVYPQLHIIRLTTMDKSWNVAPRPSFDGVPFPVLRSLTIHGRYPVSDDSILRGSEDSLTFLDLHLWDSTIDILGAAGLLDEGRYMVLESVRLTNSSTGSNMITEDRASLVLGAFHRTPMIEFSDGFQFGYTILQPYISGLAQGVRDLKIPGVRCTFDEILHLIESLPFIRSLAVTCRRSAALADMTDIPAVVESVAQVGLTKNDAVGIIAHVCQAMGRTSSPILPEPPISQTLQNISVRPDHSGGHVQAAWLTTILALRCPTIRIFRSFFTEDFDIARADLVRDKHFAELAARLSTDSN